MVHGQIYWEATMSNYAITFTTINVPIVLQSYFDNLQRYDHLQDTIIIIVGDKKTPNSDVEIICEGLRTKGMQIVTLMWRSNSSSLLIHSMPM